jgi:hypothetical protein
VNHYNEQLNKCFVLMQSTDTRSTPGSVLTSKTLMDAFEGTSYGDIALERERGQQNSVIYCSVTQPSGEETSCKSEKEFGTLTDIYMK